TSTAGRRVASWPTKYYSIEGDHDHRFERRFLQRARGSTRTLPPAGVHSMRRIRPIIVAGTDSASCTT
ncbi:hypothetical protein PFISCL1PPCAC_11885, partial [Pristionchus fissidentatus]